MYCLFSPKSQEYGIYEKVDNLQCLMKHIRRHQVTSKRLMYTCWRFEYSNLTLLDAIIYCIHHLILNLIWLKRVAKVLSGFLHSVAQPKYPSTSFLDRYIKG